MADVPGKPDICAYCGKDNWCEDRKGKPQCLACKAERFFDLVLFQPIGYRLMGWQREIIRDVFGTVDLVSGLRRYRRVYVSVAKKNGKSFLVGGIPLYVLDQENVEVRAHAYGAASSIKQAGIVYESAVHLVKNNPIMQDRFAVRASTKRLIHRRTNAVYEVISAEGKFQDGIEPSVGVIDELHRWETKASQTLYDVMTKGTISRHQPLTVEITTAGEEYGSTIWNEENEMAERVLSGSLKSDRFYPKIWAANAERIKSDPDYWMSREARREANPSHEDHPGGFLRDEALVEELDKAIAQPSRRNSYLRYHLNLKVSGEERAVDMHKWDACAGKVDLAEMTREGRACYLGLDLSSTRDMSALVLVFPDADGGAAVVPFFWQPMDRIPERLRREFTSWTEQGHLEATPGDWIDYRLIKAKIQWALEMFNVKELAYDRRYATELVQELIDQGVTCVPIAQGPEGMTWPTRKFLELVTAGRLRHGGHPVLRYNADCLTLKSDSKDGVYPAKPDRGTSLARIDGAVATIMAIARCFVARSSIYETRGLLVIGE